MASRPRIIRIMDIYVYLCMFLLTYMCACMCVCLQFYFFSVLLIKVSIILSSYIILSHGSGTRNSYNFSRTPLCKIVLDDIQNNILTISFGIFLFVLSSWLSPCIFHSILSHSKSIYPFIHLSVSPLYSLFSSYRHHIFFLSFFYFSVVWMLAGWIFFIFHISNFVHVLYTPYYYYDDVE